MRKLLGDIFNSQGAFSGLANREERRAGAEDKAQTDARNLAFSWPTRFPDNYSAGAQFEMNNSIKAPVRRENDNFRWIER